MLCLKTCLKLLCLKTRLQDSHSPSADLPDSYETNEGSNSRRAKHPDDILVLVKEYIASANLAQLPLLVLTPESRQAFRLSTDRTFAGIK